MLALAMVLPVMAMATGAIAVDEQQGDDEPGYGISSGQADKASAQRVALSECKKAGNKNCKVVVWFEQMVVLLAVAFKVGSELTSIVIVCEALTQFDIEPTTVYVV